MGHKNTQTCQVKVILILYQILVTCLQENVFQLEGRISNKIFEKWKKAIETRPTYASAHHLL